MDKLNNNKTESKLYYSKLGITTFILAVVSVALIWGVIFTLFNVDPAQLGEDSKEFMVAVLLMSFSFIMSISGIITGIIAVLQKQKKKLLPAFGLVINCMAFITVMLALI